ncbi:hypothetical protein L1965_05565 [Paracoccus sp. EGI L200073]|nr:hypothetical protein [Paracoccus salsus]
MFPSERWRFVLLRERDLDDLISLSVVVPGNSGVQMGLDVDSGGNAENHRAVPSSSALYLSGRDLRPVGIGMSRLTRAEAFRPRHDRD